MKDDTRLNNPHRTLKPIVTIKGRPIGPGHRPVLIAGPCVIEEPDTTLAIAARLQKLTADLGIPFIFKASFDKANRTSMTAYRGPGIAAGLEVLQHIQTTLDIPVLSDIHTPEQAPIAAKVLDVLQIPAFLCRQTDLILAAAATGKPVNIKKGQFVAPGDMAHALAKAVAGGSEAVLLTERGSTFGYNNLVVDFRSVAILQAMGCPVIFDATHSVQLPGGAGDCSGGQREFVPLLARAAMAAGADGLFMEVHTDPDQARCDGANSMKLDDLPELLEHLWELARLCRHTRTNVADRVPS